MVKLKTAKCDMNTKEGRAKLANETLGPLKNYPVKKEGYHIEGHTSDFDLYESVLKSFVKNDQIKLEPKLPSFKELIKIINDNIKLNTNKAKCEVENAIEHILNSNRFSLNERRLVKQLRLNSTREIKSLDVQEDLIKTLTNEISKSKEFDMPFNILNKDDTLNKFNLDKAVKKLNDFAAKLANKEPEDNSDAVYEKLGTAIELKDEVLESKNKMEELDNFAAKITKEYWQAKRRFILMNKFMEDFYNGEKFAKNKNELIVNKEKLFGILEDEFGHGVDEKLETCKNYNCNIKKYDGKDFGKIIR